MAEEILEEGVETAKFKKFLEGVAKAVQASDIWGGTQYSESDVKKFTAVKVCSGKLETIEMGNKYYKTTVTPQFHRVSIYAINMQIADKIFVPAVEKVAKEQGIKLTPKKVEFHFEWTID